MVADPLGGGRLKHTARPSARAPHAQPSLNPDLLHGWAPSPEMASLGRWLEMTLLSVRGVRMAAVFPSMLPIPSISSMKK